MKKTALKASIIIVAVTIMGFITYKKSISLYTDIPTNAAGTGTVIDATRFSNMIGNVPSAINVFVKPADSPNFVGENTATNNTTLGTPPFDRQDFFRWSHQMFLWLLSPTPSDGSYGECSSLVFTSPAFFDVSGSSYIRHRCRSLNPPIAQHPDDVIDVGNGMSFDIKERQNKENTAQQFETPNARAPIPTSVLDPIMILPSSGQAKKGGNINVLMARNGSLVYYNMMVNDVYVVFSEMVKNGTLPFDSKFPTTVAELSVIKAYAAANNIPIIDTGNKVLAMELKTSWVEAVNLPNPDDYVKVITAIPNYIQTSAGVWTRSGTRTTTLALIGMHVVGSVKGHPEMIWSTFEHKNNTPNQDYAFRNNSGGVTTVPIDMDGTDFLFSPPNPTTGFNVPHIIETSGNLTGVNGFSITPSNTIRLQPFGWGGSEATAGNPNPVNLTDILSLEDSNAELLAINTDANNRLAVGDVRKKYFQVGATWSSLFRKNQQAGTIRLSNSTMETYTQSPAFSPVSFESTNPRLNLSGAPAPDNGLNCFSCHNAGFDYNNATPRSAGINPLPGLGLTHVFGRTIAP